MLDPTGQRNKQFWYDGSPGESSTMKQWKGEKEQAQKDQMFQKVGNN